MKQQNRRNISKSSVILILLFLLFVLIVMPKNLFRKPSISANVVAQVRIISANAPTFDFTIGNYTLNQTANFTLDVNCSDEDAADTVLYYDNFTGFEINMNTGMINQSAFNESFVGNNTIKITCSDNSTNVSQTFVLEILNVNEAPVLSSIGSQIATEGELFTLGIEATDADNDNLTFNTSTTLFEINTITGLINFTPTLAQVGNYTINISVFDGSLHDYEVISFRIVRGPFCGDGSCGSGETCSSCSSDCGSCSSQAGGQEGSSGESGTGTAEESGGGGESGTSAAAQDLAPARAPYYRCDEKWECSDWPVCSITGVRARTCKDINKCGTRKKKPSEIENCEYQPTCFDSVKNGNEDGVDCGGVCKPCIVPNCFDSIKNQNEEEIDCGGVCQPCEVKKFAKIPFVDVPAILKISKRFPWVLTLALLMLIALSIASDQVYVRHIRRKKFDEYKEQMARYRRFRRKLYEFAINLGVIALIASLYIYLFSDNFDNMKRFMWVPALVSVLVPVMVSIAISHYRYYEYRKKAKERMLRQTHKREMLQLISVENQLLEDIETRLKNKMYRMAARHEFDDFPLFYAEINPLYGALSSIVKSREERQNLSKLDSGIFSKIADLLDSRELAQASKEYGEFMSISKALAYIRENINIDTFDIEQELITDIEEISKPHMITVIKSSPGLVPIYNELVDIYQYLTEKHKSLRKADSEISMIERSFTDKVKEIAKKPALISIIQSNAKIIPIYNSMIDLFNHYLKKQELSTKIRELV